MFEDVEVRTLFSRGNGRELWRSMVYRQRKPFVESSQRALAIMEELSGVMVKLSA